MGQEFDQDADEVVRRLHAQGQRVLSEAERRRQVDLLLAYRQRQVQNAAWAEEVARIKQRATAAEAWPTLPREQHKAHLEGGMHSMAQHVELDNSIWREHEQLWQQFVARTSSNTRCTIMSQDIPWPPSDSSQGVLAGMAAVEFQRLTAQPSPLSFPEMVVSGSPSVQTEYFVQQHRKRSAWKLAYRKASQRWHPDRFMARFGKRLASEEQPLVLAGVLSISQGVNAEWQDAATWLE